MEYKFPDLSISKKIKNKTTLIIVTSPIPTHPNTDIIDEAIQSAMDLDYKFYEIIVSYDCPKKKNKKYEKYKLKMKEKYPKFKHLEMKEHGHFIGTFYNALCHTKTEYFMMLQHDIKLIGNLPIEKLLNMRLNWNILATHHMKDGLKKTHWYPIIENRGKYVDKTWGWSERIFLSKRDFFLNKIKQCYESGRTKDFMDTIFHKEFKKLYEKTENIKKYTDINPSKEQLKIYNKYWDEWKCFNIKSGHGYHEHLHGRTKKQGTKKQDTKKQGTKKQDTKKKKKGKMEVREDPNEKAMEAIKSEIDSLKILVEEFPEKLNDVEETKIKIKKLEDIWLSGINPKKLDFDEKSGGDLGDLGGPGDLLRDMRLLNFGNEVDDEDFDQQIEETKKKVEQLKKVMEKQQGKLKKTRRKKRRKTRRKTKRKTRRKTRRKTINK